MPSTNHNTIKADRAGLLYKMAHEIKFDFGEIVFRQVLSVSTWKDPKFLLPFFVLLFKVFEFQRLIFLLSSERYQHHGQLLSDSANIQVKVENHDKKKDVKDKTSITKKKSISA